MTRDKRRDRQLNIDLWLIFKVQNRHFVFLVLVCLIFAPREIRKYAQKECIYKAKTAPCFFYIKKPAVYRPTINFYLGIDCYFFFFMHFFFFFQTGRDFFKLTVQWQSLFSICLTLGVSTLRNFLGTNIYWKCIQFSSSSSPACCSFRRLLPSYTATACETEYFKKQFWVLIYKKYTTGSAALLKTIHPSSVLFLYTLRYPCLHRLWYFVEVR